MDKIAIYTCITGGYDALPQPAAAGSDFDFICFAPEGQAASGENSVWNIRSVRHTAASDRMTSRYHKLNPHLILPEYEYSVWMDGNLSIIDASFYDTIRRKVHADVKFSSVRHPSRDDTYEEAYQCYRDERDSWRNILRAVTFLRSGHFPRHYGLIETNIMLRRHHDGQIVAMDELWWQLLQRYSVRDQLSVMYCIKETGVTVDYLLPEGFCARNYPALEYRVHGRRPRMPFVRRKLHYAKLKIPRFLLLTYIKIMTLAI